MFAFPRKRYSARTRKKSRCCRPTVRTADPEEWSASCTPCWTPIKPACRPSWKQQRRVTFCGLSFCHASPSLKSIFCSGPTYKLQKANLGIRRVRPWVWTPFVNSAREDGVQFHHWQRAADVGKEYPFAKFNKVLL